MHRMMAGFLCLLAFLPTLGAQDKSKVKPAPANAKAAPEQQQPKENPDLAVGKVAPDIEGEDIDGNVFRLSDYRGQVVVLDFWGNW
jgi:hypothetical protein